MGNADSVARRAYKHEADEYVTIDTSKPTASSRTDYEHVPPMAKKGWAGPEGFQPTTIMEIMKQAAEKSGDCPAIRVERPCPPAGEKRGMAPPSAPFDQWHTWTWNDYYKECRTVGKAFMSLGLEQHESVAIYGFNAPEWFIGDLGAIFAGGKAAGIYPTDTVEQLHYKCLHSNATVVVVEDAAKVAKMGKAMELGLPNLKAVVNWTSEGGSEDLNVNGQAVKVLSWKELLEAGNAVADADLDARQALIKPGHCACLIYTSGTTGKPKAVMVSHDNILYEATAVLQEIPFMYQSGEERIVSYLPLSHVAGNMVDIVCPIVGTAIGSGYGVVGFARPYDLKWGTIGGRLTCIQPTMFLGVPRVWEKIAEKMKAVGASIKGIKRSIATWAKAKGLEHQAQCQLGGNGTYPWGYSLANKIVLSKVKDKLGLTHCKFAFTGAAPITKETLEYFGALGLQINEVYGMSECTGACTFSTDFAHVWGSCGFELRGNEVKVFKVSDADPNVKTECPAAKDIFHPTEEEQGELCYRGRNVMMGYLANPAMGEEHVAEIEKKTAAAIDAEGWLHSGDKGCVSETGMFKITGRYKELIIGAGGENIAPVPIEDNVKLLHEGVSNFMMVGDKRKYNVALVSLKAKGATGEFPGGDDLDGGALAINKGVTTISGAMKDEAWIKSITDAITATNNNGDCCPSRAAKVQKFTILPRDFSVETGELTPTLKTKRSVVCKKYHDAIEAMYDPANKNAYVPFAGAISEEDVKADA